MRHIAFTLAELLIALAILGVIATFTIPKVLVANQNAKWNAIGKESIAMVSNAFDAYKMSNSVSTGMSPKDLTPFLNYVNVDTVNSIDASINAASLTCNTSTPCLLLHNGARLQYEVLDTFGQSDKIHYIYFRLDPDGKVTQPADTLVIMLYYTGQIRGSGTKGATDETYINGTPAVWGSDPDPYWFSWN